ncbi:hypothetical protein GOODEAATRI_013507 [Goodea atripinnis]|uniref:Uncharacterized protein n=1 Tax=Goodea atripinnis TaxID=208336 RepID=A0ABV0MRT5_9TELE
MQARAATGAHRNKTPREIEACYRRTSDSEAASCKMNSLGSNHSIPSTSVSTGSQSSSVNSMQEVLDDGCSDMTMMHPQDYSSTLESSAHTKKVKLSTVVVPQHRWCPPALKEMTSSFSCRARIGLNSLRLEAGRQRKPARDTYGVCFPYDQGCSLIAFVPLADCSNVKDTLKHPSFLPGPYANW